MAVGVQSCCIKCHTVEGVRNTVVLCGPSTLVKCVLVTANCTYISPQLIGVSDLLGQCKFIRAFQLYLDKGPKALSALSSCLQGLCRNVLLTNLSLSCLDTGQWCPVLGHL